MLISIIYLVISLLLDGIMSNIFPSILSNISMFSTIYLIVAFVIIYPYFDNFNNKKFYILLVIFCLLFNIMYTASFALNLVIFLLIGIGIKILYNIFPENVFMTNVISIIMIIFYHVISFVILSIFSNTNYSIVVLLKIILNSLIMTVVYTSISYYIINFFMNKKKNKKISYKKKFG